MSTVMMLRKGLNIPEKFSSTTLEILNERSDCGSPGISVSSTASKALPAGAFQNSSSHTTRTS